jgi:hypothetical protein
MGHLRNLTVDTLRRAGLPPTVAEAAVANAWDPPDPVALAHPLADLGRLFEELRARAIQVAVATSDDRAPQSCTLVHAAEGVGFEPTRLSPGGFQDRCLQPLGHPSPEQASAHYGIASIGG